MQTSRKVKIGIVGLGLRGRHLAHLVHDMVDCLELTAVCDSSVEKWESFTTEQDTVPMSKKYQDVKFFADACEMFDSGMIDAAIIETPAYHHVRFCEDALKRNLNVFGEIPPVSDLHEAKRLWDAVQNSQGMFMVGANPQRWGFVRGLRDFANAGFLGDIFFMEAEYIHDLRHLWKVSPWRQMPENTPIKYCTHSLGPLLSILKEDIRTVYCTGTGSRIADHQCNDLMSAQFQTENQVIVRLMVSFVNANRHGMHSYRVFGSDGCFERFSERGKQPPKVFFNSTKLYGMKEMAELAVDKEPVEYRLRPDILESGHEGTDYDLLKIFGEALLSDKQSPITLRDGLRITLPGIYADASAKAGGKVMKIHYPWDEDFNPAELDNL